MSEWALVTGAGVRLGKAIAIELARVGFDVVVHTHKSPADETALAIQAMGRAAHLVTADLSDPNQIATLARDLPRLTVLVNNAAIYERAAAENAKLDQLLAVNLIAPFLLTQALLPKLEDGGAIINITDAALDKPYARDQHLSAYLAAKAGLASLTKSWALELGPRLRCNAVAPGPVAIAPDATAAEKEALIASLPLRREGSPEDVARAVAYLARAKYVTGQTLRVDGGLSVS